MLNSECENLLPQGDCKAEHVFDQYHSRKGINSLTKQKMAGVSIILHEWPDHISRTTIKACLIIFAFLCVFGLCYSTFDTQMITIPPDSQQKRASEYVSKKKYSKNYAPKLQVNAPIIFDEDLEEDISQYFAALKNISDVFPMFDYTLYILLNDTDKKVSEKYYEPRLSSTLRNIFLENYSSNESNDDDSNVSTEILLISDYISQSPVRERWSNVSKNVQDFVLRLVSAWHYAGVAIDLKRILQNDRKFIKNMNTVLSELMLYSEKASHTNIKARNINEILELIDNDKDYISSDIQLMSAEQRITEFAEPITGGKPLQRKQRSIAYDLISEPKLRNYKEDDVQLNDGDLKGKTNKVMKEVMLDEFGHIVAAKTTCYAFIGRIFKMLDYDLDKPSEIIRYALRDSCRRKKIKPAAECRFITVL